MDLSKKTHLAVRHENYGILALKEVKFIKINKIGKFHIYFVNCLDS